MKTAGGTESLSLGELTEYASQYMYDDYNQMVKAGVSGKWWAYSYRPDGLRRSKSDGTETTRHIWDNGNIIMDLDENRAVNRTYLRGVRLISSYTPSGTPELYETNAHGDVVGTYDTVTGAPAGVYKYDAFGVEQTSVASDNPFRYCGEYTDSESGLIYLRARYYDPANSRWLSEDTHWHPGNMIYGDDGNGGIPSIAAIRQSTNLYVYCGNNPLMYVDPTGEAWYHWVIGGAVVLVAAAAVVVTAGGALPAVAAVGAVASGTVAATAASTAAAGAFIASSVVFGSIALDAATSSQTIKEFNDKGNWGTVLYTAGAAGVGGLAGYLAYRGSENKNIFSGKKFTNQTSTGVSNFQSSKTGIKAAEADFNALKPTNVTTYSNGTKVGYLPDGRTVNIHTGTSTGGPTLEIFDPNTSEKIKIRY